MCAHQGDAVNTTFVLDPNREATFSCTSFIAANNVWIASTNEDKLMDGSSEEDERLAAPKVRGTRGLENT